MKDQNSAFVKYVTALIKGEDTSVKNKADYLQNIIENEVPLIKNHLAKEIANIVVDENSKFQTQLQDFISSDSEASSDSAVQNLMKQITIDQEMMKTDEKKGFLKSAISVVRCNFSFFAPVPKQSAKDAVE